MPKPPGSAGPDTCSSQTAFNAIRLRSLGAIAASPDWVTYMHRQDPKVVGAAQVCAEKILHGECDRFVVIEGSNVQRTSQLFPRDLYELLDESSQPPLISEQVVEIKHGYL